MNDVQEALDPRAAGFEKKLKIAAVAVVAIAASAVVAIAGASIIVAGVATVGGLVVINVVPVVARRMALWKQSKLTQLAEDFSEETLREDEVREDQRLRTAKTAYQTMEAELRGSIDQLQGLAKGATDEERESIKTQIDELEATIKSQFDDLTRQQDDFKELRRTNELLIAFDRSARAMLKAKGQVRNPEERQRLVTARTAIKTRMRSAVAGQRVESMERDVEGKQSLTDTTRLGLSSGNVGMRVKPFIAQVKVLK